MRRGVVKHLSEGLDETLTRRAAPDSRGYIHMASLVAAFRLPPPRPWRPRGMSRKNPPADDRPRSGGGRTRAMKHGELRQLTALALTLLNCGTKQVGSTGTEAGPPVLTACSASQHNSDPCPPSFCGNGHIDTCPGGESLTELCDGMDLGSRTCVSLSYFGGTLACTSTCNLDTQGCASCGSDPRISTCTRAAVATTPAALSIGRNPQPEIDVAWIEVAASVPSPGLHFTRRRPDFTLLSDTRCFEPADSSRVGIASLGAGWSGRAR